MACFVDSAMPGVWTDRHRRDARNARAVASRTNTWPRSIPHFDHLTIPVAVMYDCVLHPMQDCVLHPMQRFVGRFGEVQLCKKYNCTPVQLCKGDDQSQQQYLTRGHKQAHNIVTGTLPDR